MYRVRLKQDTQFFTGGLKPSEKFAAGTEGIVISWRFTTNATWDLLFQIAVYFPHDDSLRHVRPDEIALVISDEEKVTTMLAKTQYVLDWIGEQAMTASDPALVQERMKALEHIGWVAEIEARLPDKGDAS